MFQASFSAHSALDIVQPLHNNGGMPTISRLSNMTLGISRRMLNHFI
jgi:hypothetical protein